MLYYLTLQPVRNQQARGAFHWPPLSRKSCSSEGHSFVCWTSFDTSGLDAKTLTVSQLSFKPPLSDTLHETVKPTD